MQSAELVDLVLVFSPDLDLVANGLLVCLCQLCRRYVSAKFNLQIALKEINSPYGAASCLSSKPKSWVDVEIGATTVRSPTNSIFDLELLWKFWGLRGRCAYTVWDGAGDSPTMTLGPWVPILRTDWSAQQGPGQKSTRRQQCPKHHPLLNLHFVPSTTIQTVSRQYGARTKDLPTWYLEEDHQGALQLQRQQECRRPGTICWSRDAFSERPTLTLDLVWQIFLDYALFMQTCVHNFEFLLRIPIYLQISRLMKEAAIESKQGGERGITARSVRKVTGVRRCG